MSWSNSDLMITTLKEEFRAGKTILHPDIRSQLAFRARGLKDRLKNKVLIQQHPNEFIQFLMWMKDNNIQRYAEVGTSRGGSLCVVDSFLRANFHNVKTYAVDIANNMVNYQQYHEKYPDCIFEVSDGKWIPKEQFDLIFIDNNLYFQKAVAEANRLRPFAKYLAFHDVVIGRWGAKRFWRGQGKYIDSWAKEALFSCGGPGIGIVKC